MCFLQKIKIFVIFENHQNYKSTRTCKNFSLEKNMIARNDYLQKLIDRMNNGMIKVITVNQEMW